MSKMIKLSKTDWMRVGVEMGYMNKSALNLDNPLVQTRRMLEASLSLLNRYDDSELEQLGKHYKTGANSSYFLSHDVYQTLKLICMDRYDGKDDPHNDADKLTD